MTKERSLRRNNKFCQFLHSKNKKLAVFQRNKHEKFWHTYAGFDLIKICAERVDLVGIMVI